MNNLLIECCANGVQSAINGAKGGASRIELCSNLMVGGLTPKYKDTMIVGGAIIPPLYGFITDLSGFKTAMILLLACYGYIYYFAKSTSKNLA